MPITNVLDFRTKPYAHMKIDAVVEPTWHDHTCAHYDGSPPSNEKEEGVGHDGREHVSVQEAIQWADSFPYAATLYFYDDGVLSFDTEETEAHAPDRA